MSLSKRQVSQLLKLIETAQQMLLDANRPFGKASSLNASNGRRRGKELEAFKKSIRAERKRGTPVADIAKKYDVTPSYIYQL